MPSGSRSRTGCYTCRVRKKKCDEQHPYCGNCRTRNLQCYGFNSSPPDWMSGKRNWKEVMLSEGARQLRTIAEVQYRARRRDGQKTSDEVTGTLSGQDLGDLAISGKRPPALESIWWDSSLCALLPIQTPPHEDARLLILYLEFIFPIQFTFYPMSTAADHSWLISGMCTNKSRYHGALGVSACFDASLREPEKIDGIGLSLEVTRRQAIASSGLQTIITRFDQQGHAPRDMARIALQILEVIHQLLSLEVFSMLEGIWEIHHQATKTLLNALHTYRNPDSNDKEGAALHLSPLEMALTDFSCPDVQRNFEFHVTCVVWIDIIANATFGTPLAVARDFDYSPYLHTNTLKTQNIMGCHSSVMVTIADITSLADWKTSQLPTESFNTNQLYIRATPIETRLLRQIEELEKQCVLRMTKRDTEIRLVTLQFAYAAQIYLHVIVFGANVADPKLDLCVNRSLQSLETLPNRVMIRVNWAYTVVGCLAGNVLHERFRCLVGRMAAQNQPLGMTWKGLIVMEECWRLRQSDPERETDCDWKRATESLGKRILLA